jgi:hypothetical protein
MPLAPTPMSPEAVLALRRVYAEDHSVRQTADAVRRAIADVRETADMLVFRGVAAPVERPRVATILDALGRALAETPPRAGWVDTPKRTCDEIGTYRLQRVVDRVIEMVVDYHWIAHRIASGRIDMYLDDVLADVAYNGQDVTRGCAELRALRRESQAGA